MDIEGDPNLNQAEQDYPVGEEALQEQDIESLIHEAKNYKQLLEQFQQQQFFSRPYYYLLSTKWLRRWKTYVSYNESVSAAPPTKFIGRGSLPKINEDIVKADPEITACFQGQNQHLNVVLRRGLQEEKDYIFLNQELWGFFSKYEGTEVKRYVVDTNDGKKVELYLQQINLIPMFADFLKDIEREKAHKLMHIKVQVSHYVTVADFSGLIKPKLRDFVNANCIVKFAKGLPVRFWLMPDDTRPNILVNMLMTGCKANPTFTYKLFSEGQYMEEQKNLCDFDILDSSYILVEMQQEKETWIFWNYKKPYYGQCGNCKLQGQLKYVCSCKFALYCSKKCKYQDKSHHRFRCPNDCESDEEEVELKFNDNSRYGLVGLRNLGNTCFMNSGLQCLSHVYELTQYFLNDNYLKEINKENPLGTKGELSTAYGKLIKNLWMGSDSSIAPTQLKRAIGKFQPMFTGYNQHDSGQLVSYLLDGLHEDLNRIKQKPYVQAKDYDGRPDFVVAKESWENYTKRNQSIIVDLMFGQFKSIVDCPQCQYESIQFDPFLMCNLPIINDNIKKMEVIYLRDHLYMTPLTVCYESTWGWKVSDILEDVKKKLQLPNQDRLIAYVTSYSTCELLADSALAEDVRQEHRFRHFYVRKLQQGEDPENDVPVSLSNVICHSYYGNETYRKSITPYRLYFLNPKLSFQQIHQKLYSYYSTLFPIQNYREEVIEVAQKEQPFRFLLIPASRYSKCEYCGTKGCQGCILPYDNSRLLSQFVNDSKKQMEIQLYWRKKDKEIQNKIDEIKEGDKTIKKDALKKSGTSIQDCFKLFEEPQTLAQDNAWYCPRCKDFVLAKKQMQIYKAPKILVICLKRFKRKEYFSEKYNIMVDFPMKDFDISEYVINHNLPNQYFKGQTEQDADQGSLVYDLVGITNHFGGTGGGHYTAYCMDPKTEKWYDFDDSCVDELKSPEDALTESAYILYYKRRE